jgi:hypothetical protein
VQQQLHLQVWHHVQGTVPVRKLQSCASQTYRSDNSLAYLTELKVCCVLPLAGSLADLCACMLCNWCMALCCLVMAQCTAEH